MRPKHPFRPDLGPFPECQHPQALFGRAEEAEEEVMLHHTFQLSASSWLTHPESRRLGFTHGSPQREVTLSSYKFLLFHLPDTFPCCAVASISSRGRRRFKWMQLITMFS